MLFAPGAVTFAHQPGWDGQWLDTLLDYGGVPGRVGVFDVVDGYGEACRPLLGLLPAPGAPGRDMAERRIRSVATGLIARAQEREAVRGGIRHRALPDAESLWRTWRAVGEFVTEYLAREAGP